MCISPPSPSCSSLFNQIKAERRGEREIEGERERGRFGTSARLFWSLLFVWIGWMMTVLIWNLEDWTTVCLNVSTTACIALSPPLALFVYTSLFLFLSFWWYVLFWFFFLKGNSTSFTHRVQSWFYSAWGKSCILSPVVWRSFVSRNWWCHSDVSRMILALARWMDCYILWLM